MFSDTHFHFNKLGDKRDVLEQMARNGVELGLDIGVRAHDLPERVALFNSTLAAVDEELRGKAEAFFCFSAGIWPDADSIRARAETVALLEKNILWGRETLGKKLVALGECGLDHHWNPSGVDARDEGDFDSDLFFGEREMFEMQLALAKKYSLPVLIHSRDAARDTIDCLKSMRYHNGIIHCYSYGLDEAREFVDLGWHISFSGSVTYAKKSQHENMRALLRFVPDDMILIETDAPYLAPVPLRGKPNNPTYIEHTYKYVAEARGVSVESLCDLVEANARKLFGIE